MERNVSGCDCNVIHPEIVEAVGKQMGKREEIEKLASFFKVLGDETRVRILWALDIHSVCVCDLSNILGMTKSAISHQLAALKRVGLVRSEKKGKTVYYSLDDEHVQEVFETALRHIRHDGQEKGEEK